MRLDRDDWATVAGTVLMVVAVVGMVGATFLLIPFHFGARPWGYMVRTVASPPGIGMALVYHGLMGVLGLGAVLVSGLEVARLVGEGSSWRWGRVWPVVACLGGVGALVVRDAVLCRLLLNSHNVPVALGGWEPVVYWGSRAFSLAANAVVGVGVAAVVRRRMGPG